MKFIKAIQKAEASRPIEGSWDENDVHGEHETQSENHSENFLGKADLKIGAPGSRPEISDHSADNDTNTQLISGDIEELIVPVQRGLAAGLGKLPEFLVDPTQVNPHIISIAQPTSSFNEEYRSLRTQIIQSGQRRLLQSIVIASVGSAEGKSVTALNLAWLMAQTEGLRILLIDADLRMPSLAKYLGFETETGLSQVLRGEIPFKQSLIRLQPAGLCLLPGGKPRLDVAELVSGPKLGGILEEARELFDFVIIDAPPLGIFTDAAVLINHADAALLVVRADHTRYKDIERKLEGLPQEKMLGVVLNRSDEVLLDNNYYDYAYSKNYLS